MLIIYITIEAEESKQYDTIVGNIYIQFTVTDTIISDFSIIGFCQNGTLTAPQKQTYGLPNTGNSGFVPTYKSPNQNFEKNSYPCLSVIDTIPSGMFPNIPAETKYYMFLCFAAVPPDPKILTNIFCYGDTFKFLKGYRCKYTFSTGDPTSGCCFSEGTKILCYSQLENSLMFILKEEYRLVQHLKIGDLVKSYLHGYRKVSKLLKGSFVNNPKDEGVANCMYKMLRTKDNGLIENLTLTRNHGVLVEKLSKDEEKNIDKNNLPIIDGLLSIITADCDKFEKVLDTNVYKYYHFSLETDGDNDRRFGVWANGLLVETPSNNMMDGALNIKPLDF
jgi:hypothetical protein